ncbi:MAG: MFS transporter [Elusimicrobia bacterium]|nr:MFS transporter [Elusimicrobiota bacterium]
MKNKIRTSLRVSFLDGTFYSVMFGLGDAYFAPFALALKATNFQIGLLTSLPGLAAALFQLQSPALTEKMGRRRFILIGVFAQAVLFLPIILVPHLFAVNPLPWLIAAVTAYTVCNAAVAPAWGSIMGQYLPHNKRGKYFSWRQKVLGIITLAATAAGGYTLYVFPRESITGFGVLFTAAMIARFISWGYIRKMYEPRLTPQTGATFSFWDFVSRARQSNFAKFVFFTGFIAFAVNLSSPFFSVYMLRDLHFNYLTFVAVMVTPNIALLASLSAWGTYTDKAGCIRVIQFTSLILPIVPVLWLFSSAVWYLVLIQIVAGFAWGGFNLAVSNFIFDAVSEEKRVRCIAYFNLVNGLGIFFGAALGGLLVGRLPPILGNSILSIFLLSGILRLLVRSIFLRKIKEVKAVPSVSNLELFYKVIDID